MASWGSEKVAGSKGVMRAGEADRCAGLGADAGIVSNHGGCKLDGACAALDFLPEVAAAIVDGASGAGRTS